MKIDPEEIMGCTSYYQFCDYDYDNIKEYPSGIICCHLEHIKEFFDKIKDNKEKYIIISPRSDYGLCYQRQFPVKSDVYKWLMSLDNPLLGYRKSCLLPRCDTDNCNIRDKYSVKTYMFTKSTFDKIPENVKYWFVSNCCIHEPNIESIPLGIKDVDEEFKSQFIDTYKKIELKNDKTSTLYISFKFHGYHIQRKNLYETFFNAYHNQPGVTFELEVPFQHYMDMLNKHKFCLCPIGNGFDTYRVWECLYMRCIPIVEHHPVFMSLAKGLPILLIENFGKININGLNKIYDDISNKVNWDLDRAKLSYWKNKIEEQGSKL